MFITELKMEEINVVNGGSFLSVPLVPISKGCQHLSFDGKCEDPFTTPRDTPDIEQLFFGD